MHARLLIFMNRHYNLTPVQFGFRCRVILWCWICIDSIYLWRNKLLELIVSFLLTQVNPSTQWTEVFYTENLSCKVYVGMRTADLRAICKIVNNIVKYEKKFWVEIFRRWCTTPGKQLRKLFFSDAYQWPLKNPRELHSILFADDTCFSLADDNYESLIFKVISDIEKMYRRLIDNKLSMNN